MEPVLLVGETGTGKTTVCQMAALMRGQRLHILNCNQHTETSDFLGGFRPARQVPCTSCAALLASCWACLKCAAAHDDTFNIMHLALHIHDKGTQEVQSDSADAASPPFRVQARRLSRVFSQREILMQ